MITIIQGNSVDLDVTVTIDGVAYNLTTHKIWFTLKDDIDDADVASEIQVTDEDNITLTDGPNGEMRVSLTPEQTQALPLNTTMVWDIQILSPEGKLYTLLIDELVVTPRVTKAIDY